MERVNRERVFRFSSTADYGNDLKGPVIYWMFRDQRVQDNWALLHAQDEAIKREVPLEVVFCLAPSFQGAGLRHYRFMFNGLKQVESECLSLGIGFTALSGEPDEAIAAYAAQRKCPYLVVDFFPVRKFRYWVENISRHFTGNVVEVDAHNIVPCRVASPKQEYAARTIRSKIHKRLSEFLEDFPKVQKHQFSSDRTSSMTNWEEYEKKVANIACIPPVESFRSGTEEALLVLKSFLSDRIGVYDSGRNDPNQNAQSGLSPYFHFGQLAPQRAAYEALRAEHGGRENIDAFIEELIVRRELADNFCFYNSNYDSLAGIADWAYRTLDDHRKDERNYVYDLRSFERARTHSELWNAAQTEMIKTGKMHGYMRMYWAKKILEWSRNPEEAVKIAVSLNDRYSLDGRDPNGYAGILWSIGGVHDRAWPERSIFGKVRYMNERGCRRKFNVDKYIMHWLGMKLC